MFAIRDKGTNFLLGVVDSAIVKNDKTSFSVESERSMGAGEWQLSAEDRPDNGLLTNHHIGSRLCKYVGKDSIFGSVKKVDLIERPTSDDWVLGNGFGTLKFPAFPLHFVF